MAFVALTSLFNLFPQECEKAGMAIIDSYHKHVEVDANGILSCTDHKEPFAILVETCSQFIEPLEK